MEPDTPQQPISLRILQLVQTSQAQHGIRHNDYDRYRQYCQRRLRKLYVSTKILHGRGKYTAKPIDASMVTDARVLHIPLINAERAWAYAQSLKASVAQKPSSSLRSRALGRIARASRSARELAALAAQTCDDVTRAEAAAYAAWMTALWLAERGQDWPRALAQHQRARSILEALDCVADYELQNAVRQLMQLIEPAARFCAYQLERQGASVPGGDALTALGDEDAPLSLAALKAGLKNATLTPSSSGAPTAATASLTWRGTVYPAYRDKVLERVSATSQARAALDACMDADDAVDARVAAYDALIRAYHHLVIVIHKELQSATMTDAGGVSAEEVAARLGALSTAARGLLGEASIARGLLMAGFLEGRWRISQERVLLGGKGKSKDKGVRPEELVQQYDALVALAHDMGELAGEVGGADAEHLMDEAAAAEARFMASRALFLGVAALAGGRAEEAVALLELAAQRGLDGLGKTQSCASVDAAAVESMQQLLDTAAALRCAAHADCCSRELAEKEGVATRLKGISVEPGTPTAGDGTPRGGERRFLTNHLDEWESFAGEDGRDPRLYELPPPMQAVAVRPLTLDSAQSYIAVPSVKHRFPAQETAAGGDAGATSTFARFFTWGGGAKK